MKHFLQHLRWALINLMSAADRASALVYESYCDGMVNGALINQALTEQQTDCLRQLIASCAQSSKARN